VARDHWYRDWDDALAHGDEPVDTGFEAAADAVHAGDIVALGRLIDARPALVGMRSPFPHHQTLLYHVAGNGIEAERQDPVPANAPEMARLLLERGADPDALCDSYGGGPASTPLCLVVSSVRPFAAGVQVALVDELCRPPGSGRRGASADGVEGDSTPLWSALESGYTAAAEALVRHGARTDTLCVAAALGDLPLVRRFVEGDRSPAPAERMGARGPLLGPEHLLEYALIWASAHGRLAVVEYLLSRNPDLTVREPRYGSTALGMARHRRQAAVEALLGAHRSGR